MEREFFGKDFLESAFISVSIPVRAIADCSHRLPHSAKRSSVKSCRCRLPNVRCWAVERWLFADTRQRRVDLLRVQVGRQQTRRTRQARLARRNRFGKRGESGTSLCRRTFKGYKRQRNNHAEQHSHQKRNDVRLNPVPASPKSGRFLLRQWAKQFFKGRNTLVKVGHKESEVRS